MESLYKIKVHKTRLCVILCDYHYPSVAKIADGKNTPEPFHEHPVYEIFLIKSGSIEFHTPKAITPYGPGVIIVPPHVRHRTLPLGCDAVCFSFTPQPKDEQEASVERALTHAIGDEINVLPLNSDLQFYIERLMHPNLTDDIPHLITLLFSSLLLPYVSPKKATTAALIYRTKHISTVETFVANNIHKKVRLSDLAAELSLSEKQSARMLKKHFGCTLSELIHKTRMESAAIMLKYTDFDVNEIAHRLGYEYENYFFTVFRKHYGITPSEYRARELMESENASSINESTKKEDTWIS